ncbi:MAG TPA: HIT domain-containing protein [Bryobacteraceae bacterium]|nr:HIT domain-containing protein [Bryobacteraceae bacterium]
MDVLWSPWRYKYVSSASPGDSCIFCMKAAENKDRENHILYRGQYNFVLLNAFPYTSGHLMVVTFRHIATLEAATAEEADEMFRLVRLAEKHLRAAYHAPGFNIGMNIGAVAGAGVAGHIHAHVLPRWAGDVNFMTTVGETRVLPESLEATYDKLVAEFQHG